MQPSTNCHKTAAKWDVRYLKGSIDFNLFYKSKIQLHVYCDSDWAGIADDKQSTSGFGIFPGQCLISSSAKKQNVVS